MLIKVKRSGRKGGDVLAAKYTLTIDTLAGKKFGPYDYTDMRNELLVLTSINGVEARGILLDAWVLGEAAYSTDKGET